MDQKSAAKRSFYGTDSILAEGTEGGEFGGVAEKGSLTEADRWGGGSVMV